MYIKLQPTRLEYLLLYMVNVMVKNNMLYQVVAKWMQN